MNIIACDIGGTEIKGALIKNGDVFKEYTVSTDRSLGRTSVMNSLTEVINQLNIGEVDAIGLVSAGVIDVQSGMILNNLGQLQDWKNFSMKETIELQYNIPTFIDNDANGAMIAEMEEYLAHGIKNAVMITLGTGVGTAVYINGEIYRGSHHQVEFGHSILVPNGKPCVCGQKGCVEAYVSGTVLTEMTQDTFGAHIKHGKYLFDEYNNQNESAIKVLEEYSEYLAIFLANISKMYDPEIIIIGGGVINSKNELFTILAPKMVKYQVHSRLHGAVHKNKAGILGAYLLAKHSLENN